MPCRSSIYAAHALDEHGRERRSPAFAPAEKIRSRPRTRPRVLVADGDGEELDEAQRGAIPGPGDQSRKNGPKRQQDELARLRHRHPFRAFSGVH